MLRSLGKLLPGLLVLCLLAAPALAQKKKVIQNAKDGGIDFQIQGEYSGSVGKGKMGVQVIAHGDGKFHAVAYIGGLPGDGWNKEKIEFDGKLEDGVAVFVQADKGKGVIKDGVLTLSDPDGNELAQLKKIVRKSKTLGKKAPEGAVVLFDGTSADAFKNGRMTDDKCLMHGCTSKELFGSFDLHLEFQLSFMPYARGQGRSNSGCYMQGRYEVQVLDNFGWEPQWDLCGGIYKVAVPLDSNCRASLIRSTCRQ